jgi:sugar (pentulose or hexulose) kinase
MAPPEGDAGTGMVATNAVAPGTGNISAGTSIFAMVVMDKPLSKVHHELDIVTTPSGDPVAMVHCNNGASELAAWVNLFKRFSELSGAKLSTDEVYQVLFGEALNGEKDAGGLIAYNYLAGEPITDLESGRPLFVRTPDSKFSLANMMIAQLYGVFGTLSIGMEVLRDEQVTLNKMSAHGGIFRTSGVAQDVLAAAIDAPVTISSSASEGGAWGMALLAAFTAGKGASLSEYLDQEVFAKQQSSTLDPDPSRVRGFADYLKRYRQGLPVVAQATKSL